MTTVAQPQENFNPALPNGEKFRCCGCLNWTRELAGFGYWVPDRNRRLAIKYPICNKCQGKVQRGGNYARKVARTAEDYLADEAKEAMAVR
jgi:hypothetical protein